MATIQDIQSKIDKITADTAAEKTVDDSIVALLIGIVAQNKELSAELAAAIANNDQAALQKAADSLDAVTTALEANTAEISAAVTENTPQVQAAPALPPGPGPTSAP
jgi:5'-deoxynucleotidase YfbR-like HD superfamily hydrolase